MALQDDVFASRFRKYDVLREGPGAAGRSARPVSQALAACQRRHDRIRLLLLCVAVLLLFVSAVLFFTLQTVIPTLLTALLSVCGYYYINQKLRAIEQNIL